MRYLDRFRLLALALTLAGCQPVLEPPPEPTELKTVPLVEPKDLAPDAPVLKEDTAPYTVAEPTPIVPESEKPAIVLPSPPPMTAAGKQLLLSSGGRELVLEFETGGRSGYDPHPEWPGGASGVTVGIGYDLGYYSKSVIDSDWQALQKQSRTRLLAVSGVTGARAASIFRSVRDIFVAWAIATDVFDRVDVAREYSNAKRAVPSFEDLRPNAQAAWISLGFNRGWQMSGPNRVEMRAARDLVPSRDYEGMARQFIKMKRVWAGTSIERGMYRRRDAEAKLILTP